MTSIVKKVLRTSGKKKRNNHGSDKNRRSSVPLDPPSPDFSGLKPDEILILKDVLKRQEEFESEEVGRQQRLRESLLMYEDDVRRSASQKSKLKNVDLRLCRLCYTTKFADGIGKACYDCHKRVCNKCGSFSRPTWNAKKSKAVKGKWRCNMCQMKRDVVAKTGIWYHGDSTPVQSSKIKSKLSISEIDSSETDAPVYHSTDPTPETDSLERKENDVFSEESPGTSTFKSGRRTTRSSMRRRNASQSELEEPDEESDVEQFQKERQMSRIQRQSKRSKRKLRSGSLSDRSIDEDKKYVASGSDVIPRDQSSSDLYLSKDHGSFSPNVRSPERLRRSPRVPRRTPTSMSLQDYRRPHDSSPIDSQTDEDRERQRHRDVLCHKSSLEERYHRSQSGSRADIREENRSPKQTQRVSPRSSSVETQRDKRSKRERWREQFSRETMPTIEISNNHIDDVPSPKSSNAFPRKLDKSMNYYSESVHEQNYAGSSHSYRSMADSRVHRDSVSSRDSRDNRESRYSRGSHTSYDSVDLSPTIHLPPGTQRRLERQNEMYYSSSSSIFSDNKPLNSPDNTRYFSDTSPSKHESFQNDIEKKFMAQKLPRNMKKGLTANRHSSNSLSPDMALYRSKERSCGIKSEQLYPAARSGSVSPKMSSDLECNGSYGNEYSRDTFSRRMTLPHCVGIKMLGSERIDSLTSKRAHEIILHRNKQDLSIRTQGFGMRVVGGRRVSGSRVLGAYVTMVKKGGPADRQGIAEGDQVIEWNGRSLIDVTFEEAQDVMNQSGNIVQLSVIHGALDTGSNQSLPRTHPIIIKSDNTAVVESLPPDSLVLGKPKRRLLPKTPVEIKRDVRNINGRIWIKLDYDESCNCLFVGLLRGEDILSETTPEGKQPNAIAMLHLLPNRREHAGKESDVKFNTKDPNWNETFVFNTIAKDEVCHLALEVTVWNLREPEDEFLGEVLLDLGEAKFDNSPYCFHLEDHDENSSPLPYRKKSFSLSDSALSPATSFDTSSMYPSRDLSRDPSREPSRDPSRDPSPRSSVSAAGPKDPAVRRLSLTPGHDKIKDLLVHGRDRHDLSSSDHSSPLHSPTSTDFKITSSLTSLVKRKINLVAKISATFSSHKRHSDTSVQGEGQLVRSQSYTDVGDSDLLKLPSTPNQPRRSFEYSPRRFELLAPPHPLSAPSDFDDGEGSKGPNPDRPAPEGDDITSLLGPGQIAPKPVYESSLCGDIKMGFMVSKGQLEIDIVVVNGLTKSGLANPPDTYVKTYLVEGAKTVQKKKTQTIRMSFDPVFRKTIKYSACNIHGRCIRVNVWDKQKTFDKKQCLGEAVVKLDSLDLSQHTMAWYKLFPLGAAEIGSVESLNFWPIH